MRIAFFSVFADGEQYVCHRWCGCCCRVPTNIDDFMVLIVFFAQVNGQDFKNSHVVAGQLLGFTVICAISLLGIGTVRTPTLWYSDLFCWCCTVLGLFIPGGYVGIIGFMPLLMGLFRLYKLVREKCCDKGASDEEAASDRTTTTPASSTAAPNTLSQTRLVVVVPSASTSATSSNGDAQALSITADEKASAETYSGSLGPPVAPAAPITTTATTPNGEPIPVVPAPVEQTTVTVISPPASSVPAVANGANEEDLSVIARGFKRCCSAFLNRHALNVSVLTVANGGDNVSIYLPLFATATAGEIVETLVIFYVLLFVWCLASYLMLRCKFVAEALSKYGEFIVPFLLIGLGLYVLSGSVIFGR